MDAIPINPIQINAELTPNPNTLKFVVNQKLLESGSRNFPSRENVEDSALAKKLYEIPAVAGVMIGADFITITKSPETDWHEIARPVVESIRNFLESGEAVVSKNIVIHEVGDTEIEQKIIQILDDEIRPAVARDGGDIIFYGYEDGVVNLHLQGSCSSCPSSIVTLKMGIENRLKQALPEIKEVRQV